GAGAIGLGFVERLRLAGIVHKVYDVDPAARDRACEAGARIATSAAAAARAATIIDVVVRTDQDVLDCMLAADGILAGAAADTLVLLHSTIHPDTTRQVAATAAERAVHVLDACMVGVPDKARAGEEIFLLGGPDDLVERARRHLLLLGSEVVHFGPLTSGNVAKIVKNSLTGVQTLMVAEASRFAAAGGLSESAFDELLHLFRRTPPAPRAASVATSNPRGGQTMFGKDLPLAAQLAGELGLDLPLTQHAAEVGLSRLEQEKGG